VAKRKALSKSVRFEVFKRDSFTCQYCGAKSPDVLLQVDHIDPVAKGGANDPLNLITSCATCNSGKSDRRLSDDTAMAKKRTQLEELQERREQLEMMFAWQKGLCDMDAVAVDRLADLWKEVAPGWKLNEIGRSELRQLYKRFGAEEVCEAMRASAAQYLKLDPKGICTSDSWDNAFRKIGAIATIRKRCRDKPYLEDLYRIRGRASHRFNYFNTWQAMQLLERAYAAGVSIEELEQITNSNRNWSGWTYDLDEAIEAAEGVR
jgi:hypothetical protein